jgi:hypothetical protein
MAPSLALQELLMRIAGSISSFACSLTIIVYLNSIPLQKKSHNQIIFNIAISELFTSIGGCLGISHNGTFKCWIQVFLTNYFPLTSIFWTTVIGYFLLCLLDIPNAAEKHRKIMSQSWVHVLCWGLPLILTFFPLLTDHYGTFDGKDGWCFLRPGTKYPKWTYLFWIIVAFFGWVYLAVFSFLFLVIFVFIKITRVDYPEPRLRVMAYKSLRRLVSYPLIILLSWGSLTVYILWSTVFPQAGQLEVPFFVYLSFSVPLLSGTLTSLAFFFFSSEARYTLVTLLFCLPPESEEPTSLRRKGIQVLSVQRSKDEPLDSVSASFHFWQTISKHFQSRVVPLPPSQGQTPPVIVSP